jgi:CRISPR/Cas system type I-B associated protein Csh2 (Cas7 group RAMP superfamily)
MTGAGFTWPSFCIFVQGKERNERSFRNLYDRVQSVKVKEIAGAQAVCVVSAMSRSKCRDSPAS